MLFLLVYLKAQFKVYSITLSTSSVVAGIAWFKIAGTKNDYFEKTKKLYYSINLQSSIPSPPFPHSLLNKRTPVTIWVSSISCRSLSRLLRVMNVPSSVCGKTLCKAAF